MSKSGKRKVTEEPSMSGFKFIGIFGGSDVGKDRDFFKEAVELGRVLGTRGFNLVYGGGLRGLKGCTVTSAALKGSKILGCYVEGLDDKFYVVGNVCKVICMSERMDYVLCKAEAFIALPGGSETLYEISNIIHWANLNFHRKPLVLLNINGFYNSLLLFLDQAVEKGLMSEVARRTIIPVSTTDQLIDQLQGYAPDPDPLVKQLDYEPSDNNKKDEPDTTLRL